MTCRYVRAKRYRAQHFAWAANIDQILTRAANLLGWCGKDGRRHTPTTQFADLFWVECNCCLFYRGVAVGAFGALAFALITVACPWLAASIALGAALLQLQRII